MNGFCKSERAKAGEELAHSHTHRWTARADGLCMIVGRRGFEFEMRASWQLSGHETARVLSCSSQCQAKTLMSERVVCDMRVQAFRFRARGVAFGWHCSRHEPEFLCQRRPVHQLV